MVKAVLFSFKSFDGSVCAFFFPVQCLFQVTQSV